MGNGHAGKRTASASGDAAIGSARLAQSQLRGNRDKGIELWIEARNPRQQGAGEFLTGKIPGFQAGGKLSDSFVMHIRSVE
jgi:hypothetical protein